MDKEPKLKSQILSDNVQKMKESLIEVNSETVMLTDENVSGSDGKEGMESLKVSSVTSTLLSSNISDSERMQNAKSETSGIASGISSANLHDEEGIQSMEEGPIEVSSYISTVTAANVCHSGYKQKMEEKSLEVTSNIPTLTGENVRCGDSAEKLNGGNYEVTSKNSTISIANVSGSEKTEKMEVEALGVSSGASEANNSGSEKTQESKTGTTGITSDISEDCDAVVSKISQKLGEGNDGVTSDASMLSTANTCSDDKTQKMEDRTLKITSDTSTLSSSNVCDRAENANTAQSRDSEQSMNPVKRKKLTGAQRRKWKMERAIAEGKPIPPRKNRPADLNAIAEHKPVPLKINHPAGLNVENAVGEGKPITRKRKRPPRNRRKKDSNVPTNSLIQKQYTAWCDPSLDKFILNTNSVSYPVGRSVAYEDGNLCTQVEPKIFGMEERSYTVMSNTFTLTGANECDRIRQNHTEDVLMKSPKQQGNVNVLGKRLSGAQQRKLWKAYKAGNQMFPREGLQTRPLLERCNDSAMWPLTQSRDYISSNQKNASLEIGTPSRQEGLQSFNRSMVSYNGGEKDTCEEQIENIEIAIVAVEYPNVLLIENDFEVIQQKLIGEIADLARSGSKRGPKFESCHFSRGFVLITCQDKETEDWLLDQVYKMGYVNGIKIKAAKPKQVLNVCKVSVWMPKPLNSLPVQNILSMLQSQNQGLRSLDWDFIDKIEERDGATLVLKIDSDSKKVLDFMNYKAYMGLTMVNFRDLMSNYQY